MRIKCPTNFCIFDCFHTAGFILDSNTTEKSMQILWVASGKVRRRGNQSSRRLSACHHSGLDDSNDREDTVSSSLVWRSIADFKRKLLFRSVGGDATYNRRQNNYRIDFCSLKASQSCRNNAQNVPRIHPFASKVQAR